MSDSYVLDVDVQELFDRNPMPRWMYSDCWEFVNALMDEKYGDDVEARAGFHHHYKGNYQLDYEILQFYDYTSYKVLKLKLRFNTNEELVEWQVRNF